MAQDVNLGGALRRRRRSLARRRALGGIRRRRFGRVFTPRRVEGSLGRRRFRRIGGREIRRHRLRRGFRRSRLGFENAHEGRAFGLGRLGRRQSGFALVRLERSLRVGRVGGNIGRREREIRFDRLRSAFASPGLGCGIVRGRRGFAFERRGRRGGDLLAQHAKAAIAQKFAVTAEERRGGQRDQSEPAAFRKRPFKREPGERLAFAKGAQQPIGAVQSSAAEQGVDGFAAAGRAVPDRGGERGIGRAKAALVVEAPQEARIRRRGPIQALRHEIFRLRSFAVVGGRGRLVARMRLRARGAKSRNRRQKPACALRSAEADAAQIDASRPPVDDKAYLLETRLADRKRRRQAAQAPRRRSLAPRQPSFESLAVLGPKQREHGRARAHDRPGRKQDRQPRIVGEPLARRPIRVEGRGGLFARQRREIGGGRWRRVSQSRRS